MASKSQKMQYWQLSSVVGFGLAFVGRATVATGSKCADLSGIIASNTSTIISSWHFPAGSNFTGTSVETSYNTPQSDLPELCRVRFTTKTSANSSAIAEIWLPEDWNGRFLAVGNGSFAGGVNYPDIGWGVRKGFATMSTNTGHESTQLDGTWMLNAPEKLIDFGHRALHLTTVAAKEIVQKYYKTEAAWSYYAGCSTGEYCFECRIPRH